MTCNLPGPAWSNPGFAGLLSATENPANATVDIVWAQAEASVYSANPGLPVYFNIYANPDPFVLFDTPVAYSTDLVASLPMSTILDGYQIAVRAAQGGITVDFSDSNVGSDEDGYRLFPTAVQTIETYDTTVPVDGYLQVSSVAGYPEQDGYLAIGDEILFYSDALDGYAGFGAFWIANQNPLGCNDGYNFVSGTSVGLFRGFEDGNGILFGATEICLPTLPTWAEASRPGIESAGDLGIGQVLELHWGIASVPIGRTLYYNVYYNTDLSSLFDFPQAITQSETVLVPGLSPGDGYAAAVRATYYPDEFDFTELEQLSGSLYAYPQTTVSTATFPATGLQNLSVNSTVGWPNSGYVVLDSEVLQYGSKTATTFAITRRDVFNFGQQAAHSSGTSARFWAGIEDGNVQYYRATTSWDKGEVAPRMPIVGSDSDYMQDSDGYRTHEEDHLTENHAEYENENLDFNPYPFCGYRATNFVELYKRGVCNTYFGGRQDGLGGVNINEVNLQRQELLLGITGEPMALLRRKWTGRQCPKLSHRHEHPHARCSRCFGTTFENGYDRFISLRDFRPGVINPNGLIMIRVSPYKNDLDRVPERGLAQVDEVSAWTIAIPQLRDSDILVRYIFDPNTLEILGEEFRYQVLHVTRNRTILGNDGQQQFALRKLDKTDPIYTYPVTFLPGVPGDVPVGSGSNILTLAEHDTLDTLVHNIAEDYYEEYTYTGSLVTSTTIYTDTTKAKKIRESQFTYSSGRIVREINIQYNAAGSEVQRLVIDYQYSGQRIVSSTAVRT